MKHVFMMTTLSTALGLGLSACKDTATVDTSVTSTKAENSAAASEAPKPAAKMSEANIADLPSGKYVMDKTHGYVTFSYWHQGFSKPIIRFDDVDAVLTLDNANPTASKVDVSIVAESIDTGVPKFDEHIKGKDMFNVAEYPTITFKSTALTQATPTTGTLTGDLTMMGVTKPMTLDVVFNKAGKHFRTGNPMGGFSATGQIMRSEWNLGYAVPNVGDAIDLRIEAEFGLDAED